VLAIAWNLQSASEGVSIVFPQVLTLLKILPRLFPCVLLVCNLGAAICCAVAGDFRRSLYWAASALCIGAIAF
jgi:hypothetical protein